MGKRTVWSSGNMNDFSTSVCYMLLWRFPSLRFQLLGVALNRSTTFTVLHFVGNVLLHAYMVHNDGCLASLKVKIFHTFFPNI